MEGWQRVIAEAIWERTDNGLWRMTKYRERMVRSDLQWDWRNRHIWNRESGIHDITVSQWRAEIARQIKEARDKE